MYCIFEDVKLYDKKSGKKKDGSDWYWLKFSDGKIFVSGFTKKDVFDVVDATCFIKIKGNVGYSKKNKSLVFNFEEVV